jgi:AraC family transcriptional regulator
MPNSDSSAYETWIDAIAESTPNRVQRSKHEPIGLNTTLVSYRDIQVFAPAFSSHVIVLHLNSIPRLIGKVEGNITEAGVNFGEISILAAGQESSWEWQGKENCETLYLALAPSFLRHIATANGYANANQIEILNRFLIQDPQIQYIGLALKTELESGELSGSLFRESLATALAARLLNCYATSPSIPQQRSHGLSRQRLKLVIDYINDNLNQDLRLANIAAVAGMSESHFTRQFKRAIGVTPYQFVIQSRVERVKLLLRHGGLTIQEVAFQVGFADQSHLTTQFKRILGVTPGQFLLQ